MSRLSNKPLNVPKGVELAFHAQQILVKGAKHSISYDLPAHITVKEQKPNGDLPHQLKVSIEALSAEQTSSKSQLAKLQKLAKISVGTTYANLRNALIGVSEGFKIKLELVGVGYRAQLQANRLHLSLGFSHPVFYELPANVSAEIPSQTEIVLSSYDKQLLGKVASELRAFRPPEVYKGKGVKYAGEKIKLKETKKK